MHNSDPLASATSPAATLDVFEVMDRLGTLQEDFAALKRGEVFSESIDELLARCDQLERDATYPGLTFPPALRGFGIAFDEFYTELKVFRWNAKRAESLEAIRRSLLAAR